VKARELKPCGMCGKGLMHTGVPLFYRLTIEVMGVNLQAVRERSGLGQLFNGNAALAEVFAPTGEIANRVHEPDVMLVCQPCSLDFENRQCLAELAETAGRSAATQGVNNAD
jgi:hypothetical protein